MTCQFQNVFITIIFHQPTWDNLRRRTLQKVQESSKTGMGGSRTQCYLTFYFGNLHMTLISQRVCPWQASLSQKYICEQGWRLHKSRAHERCSQLGYAPTLRLIILTGTNTSLLQIFVNYSWKKINNIDASLSNLDHIILDTVKADASFLTGLGQTDNQPNFKLPCQV